MVSGKKNLSVKVGPGLHQETLLDLEQQLQATVDPQVANEWDEAIASGLVPTEEEETGQGNDADHHSRLRQLAILDGCCTTKLILNTEGEEDLNHKILLYSGIGWGYGLEQVVSIANCAGLDVWAFDASGLGHENGQNVLQRLRRQPHSKHRDNRVFRADVEQVFTKKYLNPELVRFAVISRVFEVLVKQDREVNPKGNKLIRTCRNLGWWLRFIDAAIIYPDSRNNLGTKWGRATPFNLDEDVLPLMEKGARRKVRATELGTSPHYKHTYSGTHLTARIA